MDNLEKLKTAKTITIVLNRKEGPFESINRTLERLEAGELTAEEIERIRELFSSLGKEIKAEQRYFLQSRGFPPDLVQAVRVALADLFGTFATNEEIEGFSMDKVWDLLQTAYDRRQWLAKTSTPTLVTDDHMLINAGTVPSASPEDYKRLDFYIDQKAFNSRLRHKDIAILWNNKEHETCDENAFKQSVYRARKAQSNDT